MESQLSVAVPLSVSYSSIVIVKAFVLIVTAFGLFVPQRQQSRVNTSCSSTTTVRINRYHPIDSVTNVALDYRM
jgi:hypothetical protein